MADTPIIGPSLRKRRSDNTGSYEVDGIEFASGEVTLVQDFHGSAGNVKIGMGAPTSRLVVSGTGTGGTGDVDLTDVYEYVTTVSGDIVSQITPLSDPGGTLYIPPSFISASGIDYLDINSYPVFMYLSSSVNYYMDSIAFYLYEAVSNKTVSFVTWNELGQEVLLQNFTITADAGWHTFTFTEPYYVTNTHPCLIQAHVDSGSVKFGTAFAYNGCGKGGPKDCFAYTADVSQLIFPLFVINPGSDYLPKLHYLPHVNNKIEVFNTTTSGWETFTIPEAGISVPSSEIPTAMVWIADYSDVATFSVCITPSGTLKLRDPWADAVANVGAEIDGRWVTNGDRRIGSTNIWKDECYFMEANNTISVVNIYNQLDRFITSYRPTRIEDMVTATITGDNAWRAVETYIWFPSVYTQIYDLDCQVVKADEVACYMMIRGFDASTASTMGYSKLMDPGSSQELQARGTGVGTLYTRTYGKGQYSTTVGNLVRAHPSVRAQSDIGIDLWDGEACSNISLRVKI